MGNVWEAMRKHQAGQQAAPPAGPKGEPALPAAAPAQAGGQSPEPQSNQVSAAAAARPAPAQPTTNNYSEALLVHHDRGGGITEQYRALRSHLLASYPDERFSLIITSAEGNEGKTVSCLNLALALAERRERRVCVVDCDLRKGSIARYLNAAGGVGVADVLRGAASLGQAVRPTVYPNLWFIPSGRVKDEDVGELIGRPELGDMVQQLRRQFDCVLYDTPPVTVAADAGVVGAVVGEAVLVVRMNKTPRDAVSRTIRLLNAVNVKVGGIVLTHQKYFIPNYLYRYS